MEYSKLVQCMTYLQTGREISLLDLQLFAKELRVNLLRLINVSHKSPSYEAEVDWWNKFLEDSTIDSLEEATQFARILASETKDESQRQMLHRLYNLLATIDRS